MINGDGQVVIGTELDTDNFDKEVSHIEKRLNELDEKSKKPIEISGVKITGTNNLTDEEVNEYNELQSKLGELYSQKMELSKVEKSISQELKNQEATIEKQNNSVQKQSSINSSNAEKISVLSAHLEEMLKEYNDIKGANIISSKDLGRANELKKEIKQTSKEIEKLGGGKISINGITDTSKKIENINSGLENTIKKVGKWALAVFAIESAYGAVRNAISTISQYDDQIQSNLQYIQYALANALKPLIETILNLVVKLLQYVNYIAQAWFGINLFSGAKEFQSMADNSKKTAKNVRETRKSLIGGIDEITILDSDKSSENDNITGLENKIPNFDLSTLDGPIPAWLKWIVDHKDIILSVMAGITAGLLAWKLGLGGLKSLGIGIAIAGIVYAIQSIIEYLKDPSWENFGKIITGIGLTIAGVAIAFGAWPIAVAGAVVAILGIIVSHWEEIKTFFLNIATWLENNLGEFGKFLGGVIRDWLSIFDGLFTGAKQIFDGIIKIAKGDFAGGLELVIKGLANCIISLVNKMITSLNTVISPIRSLIVAVGKVTGKNWTMSNIKIPTLPKLAKGGIVNNPGKGVNMGSYVAGERGAEAILPLQNSKFVNDFAKQVADQTGNNDLIIQLLIDLNRNISELAKQPTILNINGQELAQVTYEDFENEGRRKQKSTTIKRS